MIHIIGEKIDLKTCTREEYQDLWRIYVADPIMDPDEYIYDEEKVNRNFDITVGRESWYPRVGIFLKDNIIIGELSFKRIDYEKCRCEIGIILATDEFKGKGYGSEAIGLAINYAFDKLKLNKIYADTMGTNYATQKILTKFGFNLIAIEEKLYNMKNRFEDKLYYELKK